VIKFQEDLAKMLQDYEIISGRNVNDVLAQTEVVYNPSDVNRYGNKYNIDFDPNVENNDEIDIIFFNTLINKELRLRGLPPGGTVEEQRSCLRSHLMIEQRLLRIRAAIERTQEGKEAVLLLIKQIVPCIMHGENRVEGKIITLLLAIGAIGYQRERHSNCLSLYVESTQLLVQMLILGTITRPKLWRFPLKDNGYEVSKLGGLLYE
jgi:hypothetical protein